MTSNATSLGVEGASSAPVRMDAPANIRAYDPDSSIVLVGGLGAGKKSLGFIGALHLGRRLLVEDHCFAQITGLTRAQYLQKHGKDAYELEASEVFKKMLDANRRGCVIACGATSLNEDAQRLLAEYSTTNPVIYVHREKDQTMRFLDQTEAAHYLRADENHRLCSTLEYYNLFDPNSSTSRQTSGSDYSPRWDVHLSANSSTLLSAKADFTSYLDLLLGRGWIRKLNESPFSIQAVPPQLRQFSYALRLRLSFLMDMDLEWEDLEACGDCVEIIIDCWPEDLNNLIAKQVALVRRKLACPVIFHVEENPRDQRRRGDEEKDSLDAELLALGLRLNVDFISLDLNRKPEIVEQVLRHKGRTKVIGNFWYLGMAAEPWESPTQIADYHRAWALGCDVVRMIRFCSGGNAHERLMEFMQKIEVIPDPKPVLVAYDYSMLGVRTPFQSKVLNPVKHPQMGNEDHLATVCSYAKSFEQLFCQFLLDPLEFYVLGASVSYSMTPAMHHAAYDFSHMPHTMRAVNCSTLEELYRTCLTNNFGGACLTTPFKVAIMPQIKWKSKHAETIGAVNVLLPLRGKSNAILENANSRNKAGPSGNFFGDNTDWSSILTCLKRTISPRNTVRSSMTTALVIGAGGMARAAIYALYQLGCRNIFIVNRTTQNAETVATYFNSTLQKKHAATASAPAKICHVLESITEPWPELYAPPTIIISCVPATAADGSKAADFELPQQWLGSTTGGVVVELAYDPLITPLVAQMQAFRETVSPPWVVVDGLEVVSEMAIEAFELMTGRMAPKMLMRSVCRKTWERQRGQQPSTSW